MTKGVYRILPLTIFFAYLLSIPVSAISESTTMDVTVNIAPKLQITVTDVAVTSDNNLAVGESTLSIATNNQTGFTATITTSLDDITSLDHVAVEDSIPTLTTDTTKTNFPTNYWGISLDDETYHGMPAKNGTPLLLAQTESPAGNGDRTLYFGAKVGHDKTAGAYKGTMLITAITNYVPTTLASITYMQDLTPDICANTSTPLASDGANTPQYKLIDNRDNKTYWVAKLADGKCWMTQNLDLDLSTNITLTNENTDLNSVSSWTPTRSTIDVTSNMTTTGTSATIAGWTDDDNTPYSVDPGNVYFDGTYFSSSACNYLTTNCEHFKNTKYTLNNEHGHVGNYYNWPAVVASNNTASYTTYGVDYPDSICPKGWRLPHGNGSSSGNDFKALNNAYGGITNSDQTLLSTPLFFVRAGDMWSSALFNAAGLGLYWSSTVSSFISASNLYFFPSFVDPSYSYGRYYGFSARCVARNPVTVIWNANGGTVDPATTTIESGSQIGTLPTPTLSGHNFLGWFTEVSGGFEISASTTVAANATYYAHWQQQVTTFNQAFANAGKSKQNGYYKMQDMTTNICSAILTPTTITEDISTQLIDTRDNKVYWVSKLKDGKCWMTQNLDLNLSTSTTLTNENTDLNSVTSWTPTRSTIDVTSNMTTTGTSATITGWTDDENTPYSVDPGNVYFDGTYFSSSDCNYLTTNCTHFKNTKQTLNNEHGHIGNYYNWSAVVASNNTESFEAMGADYPDSICPKGWRLPHGYGSSSGNDFQTLVTAYGNIIDSDQTLLSTPLFFVRASFVWYSALYDDVAYGGYYRSSTVALSYYARNLYFNSGSVNPSISDYRSNGLSARCVARYSAGKFRSSTIPKV